MLDYGSSFRDALGQPTGPVPDHSARRPRTYLGPAIAWSLGMLILATTAGAATFTVGTSGGCTHAGLQAALDAAAANGPGHDEIRLSADQVGSFLVWNQSVSVSGGYANCAASTPTSNTLLSGGGSRVLDISGGTGSFRFVDLAHLVITGGSAAYGGGISIGGAAYVTLEDTAVYGNVATESGGGIYIQGHDGAVLSLDQGSSVMSNSAPNGARGNGGGIACFEDVAASAVVALLDAFIYDNDAGVDGGGLYLSGCDLTSYSGGALRGIVGNRARRGGGVAARGGALVRFYGGSEHPATLDSNTVVRSPPWTDYPFGSAVRIEGAGTRLELHDSWVIGNSGEGAIGARDAESVVIDRTLGADCHDPVRCSRLANNLAALQIYNTGLTLRDTYLEENGPGGSVLVLDANNRQVQVEGCVFARNHFNSTRPRIISVNTGQITIAYSTFVDNLTDDTGWWQYVLGLDVGVGDFSRDLTFVGNLVAETAGILVDTYDNPAQWNPYNYLFDCLIVHEGTSLPPVSSATQVLPGSSPYFVDRAGHDYHLNAGSAPIDVCDTLHFAPGLDIDHQVRGYEDPSLPNWYGPYDLGADERVPASLLFADGFETGNTSRWSATTP